MGVTRCTRCGRTFNGPVERCPDCKQVVGNARPKVNFLDVPPPDVTADFKRDPVRMNWGAIGVFALAALLVAGGFVWRAVSADAGGSYNEGSLGAREEERYVRCAVGLDIALDYLERLRFLGASADSVDLADLRKLKREVVEGAGLVLETGRTLHGANCPAAVAPD